MGSIITRLAIAESGWEGLGRAVFLAPPNHGAPFARTLAPLLQWVSQPLREISTSPTSLVNSMPGSFPVDVGVIAGRFDLTVPSSRTHLSSEHEHITINATHNSMLLSGKVANLAASFLNHGKFNAE